MQIVKRDGRTENVKLEKITNRINAQAKGLKNVDAMHVASRVIAGLFDKISSSELDDLAIKISANLATTHPEYDLLAARLSVSVLHKETKGSFSDVMEDLYNRKDTFGRPRPAVSENFIKIVRKHKKAIDAEIVYKRDYDFDYLGLETLQRSYLQKLEGKIVERPQHMWMRVAIGIHGKDIVAALDTYDKLSKKLFTHATPTLFNAGTVKPQLASCFLVHMYDDSIEGIFKTLADCAKISQMAGGIGVHFHNIRCSGSPIYGTGGVSNGLTPCIRTFDAMSLYIDQCFLPNTLIESKDGWKSIENIEDDKVMTTAGYNAIKHKKCFDYNGEVIEFQVNNDKVVVTPEHIFLTVRGAASLKDAEIKNKLKAGFLQLEWISAAEITKNDVILGV